MTLRFRESANYPFLSTTLKNPAPRSELTEQTQAVQLAAPGLALSS